MNKHVSCVVSLITGVYILILIQTQTSRKFNKYTKEGLLMIYFKIDMEPEEIKCWLNSAIDYLKKYALEHNEDLLPEVATIDMIIKEIIL